jgi:nicotinamide-nucleotide amidase
MVRLRLTSRGKRSDDLQADIDAATAVLRKALGDDLMDGSSKPIEHYVGKLLMDKGLTVGTAESCTGGGIGAALVSVAGHRPILKVPWWPIPTISRKLCSVWTTIRL